MQIITRQQAVEKIRKIVGHDLRAMADKYGVTVFKDGKLNKGWAGHTLEHYLELGLSSEQAPNGEFWELKVVPLKRVDNNYKPKETMAITMINATNVAETEFKESHLYNKLKSLIICGRLFKGRDESHSTLISVGTFDLVDDQIKEQVKQDYILTRETIIEKDFGHLTGKMGVLVQPRTKGPGHGSISRAFYARTSFVAQILNLK